MLKRIMFYLMVAVTAAKFAALTYVLSTDMERLPMVVYFSTGIVVLIGLGLICKKIIKKVMKKELAVYYGVSAVAVAFNLISMKLFSRAELTSLDFLIIGTLMDIVVSATFVVLTVRENRYIRIKMNSDT